VENVRMIDRYNSKNSIVGTLYLTATHLIFVDPEANKETWVSKHKHQKYISPYVKLSFSFTLRLTIQERIQSVREKLDFLVKHEILRSFSVDCKEFI
jgi:hypothetical protein